MKKLIPLIALTLFAVSTALAQTATSSPTPGASPGHAKHKHKKIAGATAAGSPGAAASASPAKHSWFKKPQAAAAPSATPAGAAAPTPSSNAKTAAATVAETPAPGGGAGMVWVNTKSHIYHKEGSKLYGKTKQGKYMTESDAIKEGDHLDKSESK